MYTSIKTIVFTSSLILLVSSAVNAQYYSQNPYKEPVINVSGDAEIWVVPDKVIINAGVEIWNLVVDLAVVEADKRVEAMLALGEKYNLKSRHIQTDYTSITIGTKRIDRNNITGYWVRKSVSYTINDLSIVNEIMHDIVNAGANRIHNVQFLSTELKKYRVQCRALAIKAARDKALNLSAELGQEIGKAVKISEGNNFSRYWGYNSWNYRYGSMLTSQTSFQAGPADAPEPEGSVAVGQIRIFAKVNVDFELK